MAKGKIVAGLDVGTSTIKLLVIEKRNKEWEVLCYKEAPSFGLRKGAVVNVDEVVKIIQALLSETEKECVRKIGSVFVNIGGNHIYTTPSDGIISVSRANQIISQEDIDRVLQATRAVNIPQNEEVLDVFPREFIIDDQKGIKQPLSLKGVRLEAKVLLLCVFSPHFVSLTQSVLNSKLHIDDVVPSPLAAAEAVLTPQQKELGVALVDIGSATTSLAVFEEGELLHLAIFPVGSANITNDIAIGLKTEISIAESIKKEFGSCILNKTFKENKNSIAPEKKKIEVSEGSASLSFTKKDLIDIIEPRVWEILDLVSRELKKIGKQELLPCGIVFTGGGSKICRLKEVAKEQLKLPVQIGKIKNILGLEDDPTLATVAGLVMNYADKDESDGEGAIRLAGRMGSIFRKWFRSFVP